MKKGTTRGHRMFKPIEGDPLELGYLDRMEDKARLEASAKMLAALMREHPDRASMSSPEGTDAPQRLPMPADGGMQTNFDG